MKTRSRGSVVVVEIGSDWLKIAQIASSAGGAALTRLHVEKFETADSLLSTRLADAFKKLQIPRSHVVACLPRQMVNIRMLELPSTDPQEITDMVDLQSSKQTPYSQDEIVSDYRILSEGRPGYTRIMLVIAQRAVLRQRFYVLEEAGIEVDRMSVSSEGLLNWYRRALPAREASVAMLDVDSSYSDFMGLTGGELAFTKSILIGANQLVGDPGKWTEKYAREVLQAFDLFQAESAGASASRLVVTGAGAAIKGLREALQQHVSVPVEVKDSLEDVVELRAAGPALQTQAQALSLTPLVGMGLAPDELRINLIPDSVRMRSDLVAKARRMTTLGTLLMAALVSASLYTTSALYLRKAQLAALGREIGRLEPAVSEMLKKQDLLKLVSRRDEWRLGALNVLWTVHELLAEAKAESVSLNLEKNKEQLVVEGTAQTRRDVSSLVQRFEQSPMFEDVKESRPTQQDEKTGRFSFQIVCTLEKSS